jgi:HEAT repeat protein
MAGRPYQSFVLIVMVVSAMLSDVEQPHVLSDRQVNGVKAALEDPSTQLATLEWLGHSSSENEKLANPITRFLTHPRAEFQQAAAIPLGKIGDKAAVPALIDILKERVLPASLHESSRLIC